MEKSPSAPQLPALSLESKGDGFPQCHGIYLEVPNKSRQRRRSSFFSISSDGPDAGTVVNVHDDEYEETFYEDDLFDSPRLFTELIVLREDNDANYVWTEAARWVRFEEDVEVGGQRWSKPRVSTLSLHSFFELRSFLDEGMIVFDVDSNNIEGIFRAAMKSPSCVGKLSKEEIAKVCDTLNCKYIHLFEIVNNDVHKDDEGCNWPMKKCLFKKRGTPDQPEESADTSLKINKQFMKKLPGGTEGANILVGEVGYLKKHFCLLIRLKYAVNLGSLTEVEVQTRFVFIFLGPIGELERLAEIGRSIGTLLSDEVFREVAYNGKIKSHILAGMDEFLDASTLLPPGEWDPAIRIEPPDSVPTKETRMRKREGGNETEEDDVKKYLEDAGLVWTGRLFGGLINDLKKKLPLYRSDFKDAFSVQSVGAFFFLYFACLAPIVTFGGVLGETTKSSISVMEALVAGLVSNIIFGLFSGQPLTVMGLTGPILILETTVFELSEAIGWNHLSFRFWIGLWAAGMLMVLVAIDASAFVSYVTKFTAENFAALVALIFMYKSIEKIIMIGHMYPMHVNVNEELHCDCSFNDDNKTLLFNVTDQGCAEMNGTLIGNGCEKYYPDVFLLSLLLFIGTFLLSMTLKRFKSGTFFPTKVRSFISDFAVIAAIVIMAAIDHSVGINTPKLDVPSEFKPSLPTRGWIVDPFNGNPWWSCLVAFFPAIFCCMLMFMDQHITVVFVNRKEHKLKKGGGYHLDLFVVTFLVTIDSILGLPWFVSDTVLSCTHLNALRLESECAAPGEKPQFLGVRENRLTILAIFSLVGLSVVMTPLLKHIPMAVLYGVILFMGVSAIMNLQLYERILLSCMPAKYQPDYTYLRKIPIKRVHLFTAIQFASLGFLWLLKSFKETSILFPLMLILMMVIRKLLDNIFSQSELKVLDQLLPPMGKKKKEAQRETFEKSASAASFPNEKAISNVASSTNMSEGSYNKKDLKLPNSNESSRRSSKRSHHGSRRESETQKHHRLHSILDPIFAPHAYHGEPRKRTISGSASVVSGAGSQTSNKASKDDGPHNVWCSIVDNHIQLPLGYDSDSSNHNSRRNSRRNSGIHLKSINSRNNSIRHSKRSRSSECDEMRQIRRNSVLNPIFSQHCYEKKSTLKEVPDEGNTFPSASPCNKAPLEELGNKEISIFVSDFYETQETDEVKQYNKEPAFTDISIVLPNLNEHSCNVGGDATSTVSRTNEGT